MAELQDYKGTREKASIFVDPLTNLPNRYFLFNLFSKYTAEAKSKGTQLCIFMLDVDNFKHINDTYGHLRGDSVIKEAAVLLRESTRSNDTAIRYAGDEFVILARIENNEQIKHITNRITEKISTNIFKGKDGEPDLKLTISGGFAVYPRDGESLEELLNQADKALYFSKERGKNKFSDFKEVSLGTITYKEALKALSFPRFVNRLNQITKLKEIWNDVLSSWIFLVLLEGKIGLGKTRILDEFFDYLSLQGAVTLKATCTQKHVLEPYFVLSKAITEYLEKCPDTSFLNTSLTDGELNALSELIPALKDVSGAKNIAELKAFQEPHVHRINIFKGLRNILVRLSQDRGLLLCFDDIQWLDKAAFELLNYFLTTELRHKIMFSATLCEEKAGDEELPFREFLSVFRNRLVHLDVPPLSLEQTQEFVVNILPNINATGEFFQSVHKITRGNCLFVQEIIKCLVEDEKILHKGNQWLMFEPEKLDIPATLEDVLQRRLRKIDPETKEVLTEAAIMGAPFQLETLRNIIKQDQGCLFEIVDHAREKGIIGPQKKLDEANFINDYMQKAIYDSIDAGQKESLHRKAEGAIKDIYKDDLRAVIGDLLYHSQATGNKSQALEYKNMLLGSSLELFNPQEIAVYLDELNREIAVAGEEIVSPEMKIQKVDYIEISEETMSSVLVLIRSIFSALKNISLYPPMNKMREESVTVVYEQIHNILEGMTSITFSELNRIILVNSKRMPYRHEKEAVIGSFITLMIERDIKAVQFLGDDIEKSEINTFLIALSQQPDELRNGGGMINVLTREKIKHIKLEIVDYKLLSAQKISAASKIKEKLTSAVILDMLSGKTTEGKFDTRALVNQLKNTPQDLARNLTEAAQSVAVHKGYNTTDIRQQSELIADGIQEMGTKLLPGGWRAHIEDLAKLFRGLKKPVQSDIMSLMVDSKQKQMEVLQEVVSSFTINEIVEIICNGYTKDPASFLYMKDLSNKLAVFKSFKKEEVTPLMEEKLRSLGLQEAEISFVTQKEFGTLSFDEKKEMLLKLPAQFYASIGIGAVKGFIEELVSSGNKEVFEQIVGHILEQFEKSAAENRKLLYEISGDFIKVVSPSSEKFDAVMFKIFLILAKNVEYEEAAFYDCLLADIEIAIKWITLTFSTVLSSHRLIVHKRLEFLNNLISGLYKRLSQLKDDSQDEQRQKGLIENFIKRLSESELLEVLIQQLKDVSLFGMIEEIILKFGQPCVDKLVSLAIQNEDFSFEAYIYRKKISDILQKFGKAAADKVKESIVQESDINKLKILIEISGHLKDAGLKHDIESIIRQKGLHIDKEIADALRESWPR